MTDINYILGICLYPPHLTLKHPTLPQTGYLVQLPVKMRRDIMRKPLRLKKGDVFNLH